MYSKLQTIAALSLATVLTACGGGGGSASNPPTGSPIIQPTSIGVAVQTTASSNSLTGSSARIGFARIAAAPDGSTMSSLIMMTGTFDIAVPAQAGLVCKIDTDGDGVYEYIRPNCTTFQQAHSYRLGSATGVTPKMVILDSGGNTVANYSWYARLDEDTILPNASRTTWDKAGVTYPASVTCNTAVATPVTAATIQTAIDTAAANALTGGCAGYSYATIPAGTHSITSTISLKSGVILRGTQAGQTTAQTILNANINGSVISAAGGGTVDITYTGQDMAAYKNKNYITVPAVQAASIQTLLAAQAKGYLYASFASQAEYLRPIVAGAWHPANTMNARLPFPDLFSTPIDYVNSFADTCNGTINNNRSSYWCVRDYADYTVGQWVKIVSVQGNKVVIEGMFNDSYPDNYGLQYRLNVFAPSRLIENAGLEDFAITRTDNNNVSVVSFDSTANSYIRRVDIQLNFREAIAMNNSFNCEVNKTYIRNARARGGSGQGYGVAIQSMSTGCLVNDNIMSGQRHAMSIQFGASGNVLSENYAIDGRDDSFFTVRKADISIHGHYAHMNLIEGNYVGNLQISDWHGRSPFHTAYRNKVTNGIRHHYASWGSALVDNVIDAGFAGVFGVGAWTTLTVDATMAFAPPGIKQVICYRNNTAGTPVTAFDTIGGTGTTNQCNNTVAPVVTPPNSYYRPSLATPVSTTTNAARDRALSGKFIWEDQTNVYWHILSTGQSIAVGVTASPVLSNVQPYNNLGFLSVADGSGGTLSGLIELSNETPSSGLANTLRAFDVVQRPVVIGLHGVSGTTYSGLKKGTAAYSKGMLQVNNTKSSVEALGKIYKPLAVTVIHGESDQIAGNAAFYQQYLDEWQRDYEADIRTNTGNQNINVPLYISQMNSAANGDLASMQFRASKNNNKIIMVAPTYQLTKSPGELHLTNISSKYLGELFGKALKTKFLDAMDWRPLSPYQISRVANIITVNLHVPVPPIVFDTNIVALRNNFGFDFRQIGGNAIGIANIQISNGNQIKITLNGVPTGTDQRLRYAWRANSCVDSIHCGDPLNTGHTGGNIRDSDSQVSPAIGATGLPLYNWLVAFDEPIN